MKIISNHNITHMLLAQIMFNQHVSHLADFLSLAIVVTILLITAMRVARTFLHWLKEDVA